MGAVFATVSELLVALPVATHAIALLFALQRQLLHAIANRPKHAWERGYTGQCSMPGGGEPRSRSAWSGTSRT